MGIDEKYNYNGLYNKLVAEHYLKLLEDEDYRKNQIIRLKRYFGLQSENGYSKSYQEQFEEGIKYTIAFEIGEKFF